MTALALVPDPSKLPGHMECKLQRMIADGLIAYYEAEKGWTNKDGSVRTRPYRKYVWTPDGGEPVKLPSSSTLLDATCPKPGIPYWAEAQGIAGAVVAMRAGWITPVTLAEDAIAIVREHGLGAEAAKQRAADRGLNLHAINEAFLKHGELPRFADHPPEHHGYIRSWAKAMGALKPDPLAIEQLIVHPEQGYAGRLDLRARIAGVLETCEFKTQERGALYPSSHIQALLYEHGAIRCGSEPAERCRAIVLPADGDWSEDRHTMVFEYRQSTVDAVLTWWREKRPVESACGARNRMVRG